MSKAEQTRQFIIEKSAPIFNLKGYDSTSLADIQQATKLTKGAIYGNFADKNELAIAAYEYSTKVVMESLSEKMKSAPSAKEALLVYPNYYVNNWQFVFKKGGCPLMNAAIEADDHLHFMSAVVRKSMQYFLYLLQDIIEQGQAKKEFKAEIDPTVYAATLFSLMEGTILLAKTMNDVKYFQLAASRIECIVEQELMS